MIHAVIFDKDGTLFDFHASWGAWTRSVVTSVTDSPAQAQALAERLGYDLATGQFAPDSIVIAHTTFEIADEIAQALQHPDVAALKRQLEALALTTPMAPAVDLRRVLGGLRAMGLKIGLATNDTERPARRHLEMAAVLDQFDFVAGCDSGWGGKPAPGQLLAFASACGLVPGQIAMVGDSVHDMDAGRQAGMSCVGVLTGIADRAALGPHCDVVLTDISGLAGWIARHNAR